MIRHLSYANSFAISLDMEESGFQLDNVVHQYCATLAANVIMLSQGCVIGWFSPSLPFLISDETPLATGPLSNDELSWLGSINNLGSLAGIVVFGFIATFLGCKRSMFFLALPSVIFWLLIYFGNTYHHLLFARFFAGWTSGGIDTTVVLYVSEIANDKLGSLTTVSRNMGVLMIFIIGAFVDYRTVPSIFIFLPIIFLVLFAFLPNTPQYYLQKEQIQKAEKSLKFYKGYKEKNEREINAFGKEFERLQSLAKERKEDNTFVFSDFAERKAIKGLLFGIFLGWLSQFPGHVTFLNYAVLIFDKAGASKMDPHTSSIIIALAQILGGLFSTQLADSLGRKLSMIISFLGSAIALLILSVYLYLNQNGYDLSSYSWVPVACLSFVMFITSSGIAALYVICCVEYLPTKIRTIGLTICILVLYATAFIFIKLFPIFLNIIDLHGCMIVFMIGSVIGALFVIFALEETKGRPLDALKSPEKK